MAMNYYLLLFTQQSTVATLLNKSITFVWFLVDTEQVLLEKVESSSVYRFVVTIQAENKHFNTK